MRLLITIFFGLFSCFGSAATNRIVWTKPQLGLSVGIVVPARVDNKSKLRAVVRTYSITNANGWYLPEKTNFALITMRKSDGAEAKVPTSVRPLPKLMDVRQIRKDRHNVRVGYLPQLPKGEELMIGEISIQNFVIATNGLYELDISPRLYHLGQNHLLHLIEFEPITVDLDIRKKGGP